MPKINLLEKSVYELIAAGEVIERPSSVIKELAENSVDAGARTVTVEIKRGGIAYIRVSDDGCGMAYEDIPLAFQRHATSKVFTADDLDNINTLGFRGEALASVSAVSRVEVVTKRAEDKLGSLYRLEGGEPLEYDRTGCANGTSIIIRDLFFNTPARLKFLKKDVTEGNYCAAVIEKLALSHPNVSFRFIRDGRQTLITSGDGDYYGAIYAVFGKQFAAGLVPVDGIYRDVSVTGYVSAPLFTRSNRSMQSFFVNGRSVKSPLCCAALEEAFRNGIMVGRFPACVLCVNLDPAQFDANISPAKTEVRFSNEKAVFDSIYVAVKNALMGYDESREIELPPAGGGASASGVSANVGAEEAGGSHEKEERVSTMAIPSGRETAFRPDKPSVPPFEPQSAEQTTLPGVVTPKPAEQPKETPLEELPGFAFLSQKSFEKRVEQPAEISAETEREPLSDERLTQKDEGEPLCPDKLSPKAEGELVAETDGEPTARREEIRVIGELFKTYILCESGGSLMLIDKHAAHERINFERFRKGINSHGQMLLEPKEVYLSPREFEAVSSFNDRLANVGLLLRFSENGKVLVEGVPQYLDSSDPEDLLQSIAGMLAEGNDNAKGELFDEVLHMMACKASIRANENNDISELAYLADRVINDRDIRYCPHGRPVLTQISKRQIEKYFGRIV